MQGLATRSSFDCGVFMRDGTRPQWIKHRIWIRLAPINRSGGIEGGEVGLECLELGIQTGQCFVHPMPNPAQRLALWNARFPIDLAERPSAHRLLSGDAAN
jgi:hypothetical protein